jgi:hypothetical protein
MCPQTVLICAGCKIEPGKRLGAARSARLKAGAQAVGLVCVAEVTAIWAAPSNTTTALRAEMTILGGVREHAGRPLGHAYRRISAPLITGG